MSHAMPYSCPIWGRLSLRPLFDNVEIIANMGSRAAQRGGGLPTFICTDDGHIFFVLKKDIEIESVLWAGERSVGFSQCAARMTPSPSGRETHRNSALTFLLGNEYPWGRGTSVTWNTLHSSLNMDHKLYTVTEVAQPNGSANTNR
jgi:hypothetical protein